MTKIKMNRVTAIILAMMVALSVMFTLGTTTAYATAYLSGGEDVGGQKAMAELLNESIASNTAINKYASETEGTINPYCLGSSYTLPSKEAGGTPTTYIFFSLEDGQFTFNGAGFEDVDDGSFQQAIINEFASKMADKYKNKFSDADRQAIYNEIKDNCGTANAAMVAALFQDTKADMFSALRMFQPFSGVVGTILGVIVLLLVVLLIGSTGLDLAYINFPIARNFMYGKQKDGEKGAKRPWGVTMDAWTVVDECEAGGSNGGGYKNPNIAYFKKRVLTYVIMAIMILYLLSGQIAGLISWLMSLVSGFGM